MDNIEKITTILEVWQDEGTDYVIADSFNGVAHEIDKYYSQPLDDKGLREKLKETPIEVKYDLSGIVEGHIVHLSDRGISKFLALLQPKIEEARKAGFDDGVKKTTDAMDSTIDAQLEEAKKQERERILANLPVNPWIGRERGCNPDKRVAVDIILDKVRQALKGGEPDES